MIDLPKSNAYVSNHALTRFVERYPEVFKGCGPSFGSRCFVVKDIVRKSRQMHDWKMNTFFANSVASKHGPGCEVLDYQGKFHIICRYTPGAKTELIVLTVVPRVMHYAPKDCISVSGPSGARYVRWDKYEYDLHRQALEEYVKRHGGTPQHIYNLSRSKNGRKKLQKNA